MNFSEPRRQGRKTYPINRQLWSVAYYMAQMFFAPFFRIDVKGIHFIPAKDGFILLPKHQRWQDIPLLCLAAGRPLYYVAKYELFYYPFVRGVLEALGGIPLNRDRPIHTRGAFRASVDVLEKGNGLVLFPEGTYFQNNMGKGRGGMLRFILNRIEVPLIPVGIQYRTGRRPQKVSVRFGAPIKTANRSIVLEKVMAEIAALSGFPAIKR